MRTRQAIAEFIASRKAMGLTKKSIRWYAGMLEAFARLNKELPADPGRVEAFLGALNVSDETRHGYFRALRAFYGWISKRHALGNPMETIKAPRRRRKVPYSLTMAELGYLLVIPLERRNRALVNLLIDTGVRVHEAVSLVRDDILEETIIVCGKTGQREVPISGETRQMLLDLGTNPVFRGSRGALTESGAYRIVRLAFEKAGIAARKWGPHTLRHTFGRQYIMAGGDLVSLQRILGHTDIKTTRIYAELDLRDITHQHHRFSPLKIAQGGSDGRRNGVSGPVISPVIQN